MNKENARKLCEILGVNPDAPVGKVDRATALAELMSTTEKPAAPKPE